MKRNSYTNSRDFASRVGISGLFAWSASFICLAGGRHVRYVLYATFLVAAGLIVCTGSILCSPAFADEENPTGIVEKTGAFLPLDASFLNSSGQNVILKDLINKPTLVLPVYFTCPQICSFDMANLALALQQTRLSPEDFSVITMSFNHEETAADAAKAKKNYTAMLDGEFPTSNWYFLTGTKEHIMQVTDSIGYTFKAAEDGLFLHPSALVAVAKDGKIIKYVYGSFLSGDVDLALAEAQKGTPATSIKRFINYCISGEIAQNKTVMILLKSAVLLTLGIGGFFLFRLLSKGRT